MKGSSIDYVQRLSENMQLYAEEDYLTGDCLYFEYDADVSVKNLDIIMMITFSLIRIFYFL